MLEYMYMYMSCMCLLSVPSVGMPRSMLAVYNNLQEKLSKATEVTQEFTSSKDPALKKYRFELQKAITMTVNSISANSGEDLRGKIARLQRLVRGDSIEVMGKPLSIRNHPAAKMYCCNLLATKLVVSDMFAPTTAKYSFPHSMQAVCVCMTCMVKQERGRVYM